MLRTISNKTLFSFFSLGIAAFGDAPSAAIPAAALIAIIGSIAAYNFSLIGRLCAITGATSYRGAWEKSVGASTAWIPAVSCVVKTFFAILAYSMVSLLNVHNLLIDSSLFWFKSGINTEF